MLRLITGDATCKKNERALVWNQRGARRARPAQPGAARARPDPPGPRARPAGGSGATATSSAASPNAVPGFQTSGTCAPPPLCNDDGFEPDDTLAQATAVDLGTTTSGVACAGRRRLLRGRGRRRGGDARRSRSRRTAVLEVALLDSAGQRARERRRQQPAERQHARARSPARSTCACAPWATRRARTRSRCDRYRGALMALYDLPLDELATHRCSAPEPPGLDAFWARTLDEARALATPAQLRALPPGCLRGARRRRRDVQRLRRRSDPRRGSCVRAPPPRRCPAS